MDAGNDDFLVAIINESLGFTKNCAWFSGTGITPKSWDKAIGTEVIAAILNLEVSTGCIGEGSDAKFIIIFMTDALLDLDDCFLAWIGELGIDQRRYGITHRRAQDDIRAKALGDLGMELRVAAHNG